MRPLAVNVLAGIGGFALGVEQAGFNVVAALEPDRSAAATFAFNSPLTATTTHDLRGISPSHIGRYVRGGRAHFRYEPSTPVDLVFGGPLPVINALGQPPAVYQREMLTAFTRAAMIIRPKFVMLALEAATMPSQRDVAETYRAFGEHGYEARVPATLDIAWFGVPQSRALTIILAAREDMSLSPLPSATTSPEDHLSLPLFASVPQGPTVNEAIGNLAMLEKGRIDLTRNDRIVLDAAELAEFDRFASDFTRNLRRRSAEDYSYERTWNPALLTNVKTETPMLDVLLRYSRTTPGNIEPTSGLRRLNGASAAVSLGPSVLGEGFARPIHPTFARRISTREAARIQAFPDWFLFQGIADYEFTYVANSVSPRFARELGATLLRHLRQEPISPTRALTRRVGGTRSVFVAA